MTNSCNNGNVCVFRALHGQSEVKVDHRLSLLGGRTHKRKKKPDVMYPKCSKKSNFMAQEAKE